MKVSEFRARKRQRKVENSEINKLYENLNLVMSIVKKQGVVDLAQIGTKKLKPYLYRPIAITSKLKSLSFS